MLSAPVATPGGKNIGATIRIGREIWCLPYAGFLKYDLKVTDSEYFWVPDVECGGLAYTTKVKCSVKVVWRPGLVWHTLL